MAGRDRVERGRHADEVAAEILRHPHLGRRLVVRPAELDVDALVERRVHLPGDRPQPRRVQVGEVDERRPLQRGGGREVDVVADEHRRARRPGRVEPAAPVGQDDGRAAGRARGADARAPRPGRRAPRRSASASRRPARRFPVSPMAIDRILPLCPAIAAGWNPGTSAFSTVATVGPMRPAVSPQPEPRTSATSWVAAPVRSAMTVAAALATSKGSVPGSLRSTLDAPRRRESGSAPTAAAPSVAGRRCDGWMEG